MIDKQQKFAEADQGFVEAVKSDPPKRLVRENKW